MGPRLAGVTGLGHADHALQQPIGDLLPLQRHGHQRGEMPQASLVLGLEAAGLPRGVARRRHEHRTQQVPVAGPQRHDRGRAIGQRRACQRRDAAGSQHAQSDGLAPADRLRVGARKPHALAPGRVGDRRLLLAACVSHGPCVLVQKDHGAELARQRVGDALHHATHEHALVAELGEVHLHGLEGRQACVLAPHFPGQLQVSRGQRLALRQIHAHRVEILEQAPDLRRSCRLEPRGVEPASERAREFADRVHRTQQAPGQRPGRQRSDQHRKPDGEEREQEELAAVVLADLLGQHQGEHTGTVGKRGDGTHPSPIGQLEPAARGHVRPERLAGVLVQHREHGRHVHAILPAFDARLDADPPAIALGHQDRQAGPRGVGAADPLGHLVQLTLHGLGHGRIHADGRRREALPLEVTLGEGIHAGRPGQGGLAQLVPHQACREQPHHGTAQQGHPREGHDEACAEREVPQPADPRGKPPTGLEPATSRLQIMCSTS